MSGSLGERPRAFVRPGVGVSRRPPTCRRQSLAPLALVLAAGGLTLNLPCALLVCAVADCALIDLHLSARWYHRRVRVAIWPCHVRYERNRKKESGANQENGPYDMVQKLNFKLAPYIFDMVFCVWSLPHHVLEVKLWAVKMFHLLCSSDFRRRVSGQTPGLIIGQSVFHWLNPHTDTDTRKKIILVLVSGAFQNRRKRKKKTLFFEVVPICFYFSGRDPTRTLFSV